MTTLLCGDCKSPLVETKDAIGRPRYRCPKCQGVNTTEPGVGTVGHLHRQTALNPDELAWPPARAPRGSIGTDPHPPIYCRRCGAEIPRSGTRGRPRTHCGDETACRQRAPRAA